jgi:dienelactone hydrolase
MRAAGVDWRINVYGRAQHSFTHPLADGAGIAGISYDAVADARSWGAMIDTFDEVFA